jgi:DNA-binding transcriptional MerR regulator/uncharacterized glyoxalase superfamily protein PhnB
MQAPRTRWTVGELARGAGLTVRTLRYYDQIGLLQSSRRAEGGRRLYQDDDVRRLYRICLLRRIGFTLEEVAQALDDPDWDLDHALHRHRDLVDHRLATGRQLRERLTRMISALADEDAPTTTELLGTMEAMVMLDSTVQRRISILVYADIAAAHDYLVRVFQLRPGRLEHDSDGHCVHGEVEAGDGMIWLHQESAKHGLASPRSLGASTGTTAVMVEDVDAHYRHAQEQDAEILYPPTDMSYGYREYSARDLEGGLWSFMAPLD